MHPIENLLHFLPDLPDPSDPTPLLAICLMIFPSHDLCLAILMHHTICDGFSSTHFVKCRAAAFRSASSPLPQQIHHRRSSPDLPALLGSHEGVAPPSAHRKQLQRLHRHIHLPSRRLAAEDQTADPDSLLRELLRLGVLVDVVLFACDIIGRSIDETGDDVYANMLEIVPKFLEVKLEDPLTLAGSPKLRVYDTNFGWGKPLKAELTSIRATLTMSIAGRDKD